MVKKIEIKIENQVTDYYYRINDKGEKIEIMVSNMYFEPDNIGIPIHIFYYDKSSKLLISKTPPDIAYIKEIETLILKLEGLELRTK